MQNRRVVGCHGITDKDDAAQRGYLDDMTEALTRWGQAFDPAWVPDVREVVWASLARKLAGRSAEVSGGLLAKAIAVVRDYADDVVIYSKQSNRDRIIRHVMAQMDSIGPDVVWVTHSLGTVIACDCVAQWLLEGRFNAPREEWPISAWLTLGSPLGLPNVGMIDDWLYRGEAMLLLDRALPKRCVWHNYADAEDVVVHPVPGKISCFEEIPGYVYHGAKQMPTLDTGGIFDSHVNYTTDPVVIADIHYLMGCA